MGSSHMGLAKLSLADKQIGGRNGQHRWMTQKIGMYGASVMCSCVNGMGTQIQKVVSTARDEDTETPSMPLTRSLLETRTKESFCRNLQFTLSCVLPNEQPEDYVIPEQVRRLTVLIEESVGKLKAFDDRYDSMNVWEDIRTFEKLLDDTLHTLRSAVEELKYYIPSPAAFGREYRRSISLESLESNVSEKENCAHMLKAAVQEGYEVIQKRFNHYIRFVTEGFQREPRSIDSASLTRAASASHTMSILCSISEFETQTHGLDVRQFTLPVDQALLQERRKLVGEMIHSVCRHLMFLQESLFLMDHLLAKGSSSIRRFQSMSKMIKGCWKEAQGVVSRMIKINPVYTEVAYEYYGRLLWHAASIMAGMQDSDDVNDFLKNGSVIPYEADMVKDLAKSQLWVLRCADELVNYTSRLMRKMKSSMAKRKSSPKQLQQQMLLLKDLKSVVYDLVMTSNGRASWLTSCPDQTSVSLLMHLKEQGSRTLQFVLNYNTSEVSLKCDQDSTADDITSYSALVCATNVLRNGVLMLHGLLQRQTSIPEEEEEEPCTPTAMDEAGIVSFHQLPRSQRLRKMSRSVNTYPVEMDGSVEFEAALARLQEEDEMILDFVQIRPRGSGGQLTKSPWETDLGTLTEEEEEPGTGQSLSNTGFFRHPSVSNSDRTSSIASLELMTNFADVDSSGELPYDSPIDMANGRFSRNDSKLSAQLPPSSLTHNSPFAEQPSERPGSASSGWGYSTTDTERGCYTPSSLASKNSSGYVKDVLAGELVPGPLIGEGSEGHVLQMSYHKTPVAVKIMNHTCVRTRERFKNETKLLSKLSDHDNIVRFVGKCKGLTAGDENAADLAMVMEFCNLGNLYKIISEAKWIQQLHAIGRDLTQFKEMFGYSLYADWKRRLQVARDIAAGAAHMHHNDIVHRDLTSFNVVLKTTEDRDWVAKICDFERSRRVPRNQTIPRSDNIANSPAWSAPEVLREDPYSVQADVFSFGVILWELWTLEEPWKHSEMEIRNPLMIIPMVGNGARLKLPQTTNTDPPQIDQFKTLIEACWNENPSDRPTMQEAHTKLTEMISSME